MSETQMSSDVCPICAGINEPILFDHTLIKSDDIVFRTDSVVALINSFFIQGSEGHVIVVPAKHYKNLYELPDEVGSEIFQLSKRIAVAMRQAYPGCEGITVQQNNERSSGQHALHYHLHIIPRYHGDLFGTKIPTDERAPAPEAERARFSGLIQEVLAITQ